jgi:hypothetical protein
VLTARLEAGAGKTANALSVVEELTDLPLTLPIDSTPTAGDGHRHAAEVFNDLLAVIGRYEQAELDRAIQRQRLLLASTNAAEAIYAQVFFPVPDSGDGGYREEKSRKILLAPEEWQQVAFEIPRPETLRTGPSALRPPEHQGNGFHLDPQADSL